MKASVGIAVITPDDRPTKKPGNRFKAMPGFLSPFAGRRVGEMVSTDSASHKAKTPESIRA
jgi:hypothetical protein